MLTTGLVRVLLTRGLETELRLAPRLRSASSRVAAVRTAELKKAGVGRGSVWVSGPLFAHRECLPLSVCRGVLQGGPGGVGCVL